MVHAARDEGHTICTLPGEGTSNTDLVTCAECLFHLITETLADRDAAAGSMEALEYCRLLAQLTHPDLVITVIVGRPAPTYAELN